MPGRPTVCFGRTAHDVCLPRTASAHASKQLARSPRCLLPCTVPADDVVSCFKVQAFLLALFCWILPAYVLRRLEKQVGCCLTAAVLGYCRRWQALLLRSASAG